MSEEDKNSHDLSELRRKAEEVARKKKESFAQDSASLSASESRKTLHELRVHQIELEMQNEELRKALLDLEASREQYFELYDQAPVGYCTVGEDGLILEANLTVATLLGKSGRRELLKHPIHHFIHREDQDIYYIHRKKLTETGGTQGCQLRMVKEDGTIFWVDIQATSTQGRTGDQIYRVILSDITERKRAEEGLIKSERKFRTLFETMTPGVFYQRSDYTLIDVNPAALKMFGLTRDQFMGRSTLDPRWVIISERGERLPPEKFPSVIPIRTGKAVEDMIIGVQNPQLDVITWMSVDAVPQFRNRESTPFQVFVTMSDITEQKKATEALHIANKKLQILSSITRHDILNHIMLLQGYLDLVRLDIEHPVHSRYLAEVDSASNAIQHQIEFTRLYEDLGVERPDWLSLWTMIELIDDGRIPIQHEGCSYQIFADPMFEKVFANLLENTIWHGEGATHVEITCMERDGNLFILWEDDGPGVPEDQKERIFEQGVGKRTGFGLFLIREILTITGISIRETGISGEGARFEISVPKGAWSFSEEDSGQDTQRSG